MPANTELAFLQQFNRKYASEYRIGISYSMPANNWHFPKYASEYRIGISNNWHFPKYASNWHFPKYVSEYRIGISAAI
jgi:hypothetical protein